MGILEYLNQIGTHEILAENNFRTFPSEFPKEKYLERKEA